VGGRDGGRGALGGECRPERIGLTADFARHYLELFRKAIVAKDDVAQGVNEHVLGFYVAMDDAEPVEGFEREYLDNSFWECIVQGGHIETHQLGNVKYRVWGRE